MTFVFVHDHVNMGEAIHATDKSLMRALASTEHGIKMMQSLYC